MGLGAVVHTLNPRYGSNTGCLPQTASVQLQNCFVHDNLSIPATCRLFKRELHYIVNHAEDDYIILDVTFVDLMVDLQQKMPTVKGFIILSDRQHMPRDCKLRNVFCYEDLLEVSFLSGSTFRYPILTAGLDFPLCLQRLGFPSWLPF